IGAGVLVDPKVFLREVEMLKVRGRIGIDKRCCIIEESHIERDRVNKHLSSVIGTTGTGCGPANVDRVMRVAKQAKDIAELQEYIVDAALEINQALDRKENVILEGTQGFGISLFYGTYPYVTSKDTSASQVASDVGVGPTRIKDVIVVFKTFPTRVGSGPFATEMPAEEAKRLGIEEFGTVTGRRRRIGWWNGEMGRYSAMVNGATQAALTGIDKLDSSCYGAKKWEELSEKAKQFVLACEKQVRVPFTLISTGPELSQIIDLRSEKIGR
ncbi:MAG: adenylosuccinate synthetase, partial [Halobacteria archaeon]